MENAIAQILEQIYEPKFYNEGFGFRPDRRFLELIEKFLKAGIMENGKYLDSERGTP